MKQSIAHAKTRLRDLTGRIGATEKRVLLILALVVGACYGFVELAEEVIEGDTHSLDSRLLLAFRSPADLSDPLGPRWLEEMMRDFTALGSMGVLVLISAGVVGFLLLQKKPHVAGVVMLSIVGGIVLSQLMKWGFDRPRPDLVPHHTQVYTQSFPSGHAMLSAVVYLTLGTLLVRTSKDVRVKLYLMAMAALLTVVVGVSRVYLGVHWPSDVLAGWVIGAAWALLWWLVLLWLQSRGSAEPESAGAARAPP